MYLLRKNYLNNFLSLIVLSFCIITATTAQINWQQTNGPYGGTVYALEISGTNLFAATRGNIYLSTNNGSSWNAISTSLGNNNFTSIVVSGANIFVGSLGGGVFLSNDNGLSWTQVNNGLTELGVTALAVSGTNLFAGSANNGVFLSTNNGANWSEVNNGLTKKWVTAFAVSGTDLFASNIDGVFLSTNNGSSWSEVNTGLTNNTVFSFALSGSNIFAGTGNGGIFLSSDKGSSWIAVNAGLDNHTIMALATSGTDLYAGTGGGSVFKSTNNGLNWSLIGTGMIYTIRALKVVGTNIYVGTDGGNGITMSTNSGVNWNAANSGLIGTSIRSSIVSGRNIFVGTYDSGVFLSTNNGSNWTSINTGLMGYGISAFAVLGTNLFAGTDNGVFLSTNNGASWNTANNGLPSTNISSLVTSGTDLFAGTTEGVFLSTDNGSSWSSVSTGLTNLAIQTLAVSGTNLIAGTSQDGVFISTNNGASWSISIGLAGVDIYSFADSGTNIFAGTNHGVFLSTNSGSSWYAVNAGISSEYIYDLAVSGTNIFAGSDKGVFLSTNMGASWNTVNTGLTNTYVLTLDVSDTYLFAGASGGGVFIANISQSPLPTAKVQTFQKIYGGRGDDEINKFIPTPDGGYLAAAYSTSCTSADIDVCLFKTDSAGTLQWARNFGDSESDYGSVGIADATGYLLVGYTDVPGREQDMFLARTDLLGHIQWKKTYGGIGNEFGGIIHRTLDGNYVITGNTTSFGSGTYDGFLMKTDSTGNVLWFRTYARMPEQTDLCNDVLEESDGSFIMTGATYEWGDHDMMLVKTDPFGNLIWSKKYSLPYQEMGNRVVKASNGDYFIVAESGPTTTDRAAVLYRVDPAGNLIWTKTYRSPISGRTFNSARGVAALPDGGIVIVGKWDGSGLDNNSSGFILKADSNGNVAWCREYSGSNTEFSWSVYQTNDGGFVLGGLTDNSGNGGKDCYLVKTDENGLTGLGDTSADPIVETPIVSVSTVTMNCSTQSVTGIEGQFLRESDACFDSNAHPSNDLVAYYPFNSNANDSSGNGYNATYINTSLTTDRFGNNSSSYSFNGTNNTIQYGDILDEVFCAPVAKFTITGWANTRTCGNYTTGGGMIMSKSSGGGGVYQWNITHQENQVNVAVISDGIAQNYLWLTSPMPTNQWFQFTLVFDGSLLEMERLKLYLNGQSSNTTVYKHIGTLGTSTQNSTQNVCIAASHEYGDPQNLHSFYDGSIDDIRIYSKALTQEEIDSLYHEGGWNPTTYSEPRVVFSRDVGGPIYAGISVLGDNAIYAIASGYAVYRLNTDGSLIYELQVNGEIRSASSIAHDNTVYIASSDRNLYAFTKEGNSAWPPLPTGGILTATPTIDSAANRLYIGVSNHNFIAVNRTTGDVAWNYFADDEIRNSAVITGDRKLVFATQKGTLYGFDLENLSLPAAPTWQIALPDTAPSSFALDKQGNIYLGTGSGKLLKVALPAEQQPQILWQTSIGGPIVSAPVIDSKGTLYVGSIDAKLYAIDISSGTMKWSFATSGPIQSTPTISNQGNIFVANDNGEVYSLDSNHVVRWYYKASNAIVSPLLYYKSTLFFGTLGNEVIALYDSSQSSSYMKSSVTAQVLEDPMWSTFQGNIRRTGMADVSTSTGVENDKSIVPTNYALFQNYPNPFNPSTIISYELPSNSKVTIKVYNMLGQQLFMLVNDYQSVGYHEVKFESSSLPSGIYFYQMTAGSYVQTKKMILMK